MADEPIPPVTLARVRDAGAAYGESAARTFIDGVLEAKLAEFVKVGASRAQATVLLDGVLDGAIRALHDLRASLGGGAAGRA